LCVNPAFKGQCANDLIHADPLLLLLNRPVLINPVNAGIIAFGSVRIRRLDMIR
jgi:hypothetical protein